MSNERRAAPGLLRWPWLLLGAYLVCVVGIIWLLIDARHWAIATLSQPQQRAQWEAWREEAKRRSADGPVQRRVPRSPEPPALVLLRDHFGTSLAALLTLFTALFWTLAWMLRGVLNAGSSKHVGHG